MGHIALGQLGGVKWRRLVLLAGLALLVVCLLIGDQGVDCKADEESGDDDGGDEVKESVVEKKVTSKEGSDEKKGDDGEEKHNKKSSASKEVKKVVKVTVTTTTTTAAPASSTRKHGKGGKKKKKKPKIEPRVSGGIVQAAAPGFMVTLWHQRPKSGEDGRYLGNAIILDENKMIMHSRSMVKMEESGPEEKEAIQFGTNVINIEKGPNRKKAHDFSLITSSIGGSPFELYEVSRRPGISWNEAPYLPKLYASLEENANNYGADCHIYGFSKNLGSGPDADKKGDYGANERPLVKIPVTHEENSCHRGHCELRAEDGSVCDGLSDYGNPVLCGRELTLTYITEGISGGSGAGCQQGSIPAFHTAEMVDVLKQYVPNLKTRD